MAYNYTSKKSGKTYYLHSRTVTLKSTGKGQTIFYFAQDIRPGSALDQLPAGFEVVENERTGLPFLKKK
ncbi:MAG: hypothetical protein M1150_04080 [Patescibacteria group bacterium]|nr:hypothetical protein [Patescibacteria group bacterium]